MDARAPGPAPPYVRLHAVVLAAAVPGDLARFWARALGWRVRSSVGGAVELVPTDATTFAVQFVPGAGGKEAQNPIHFDLTTSSPADQQATVADLCAHGAAPADVGQGADETHVVLADPEGNELCVLAPGNRFLAGCPRLGAVNCDGTRALGQFYSAALGWPLVWDQDEETAIQAPDGTGPKVTWSGPPLMPRVDPARVHLHLAPTPGVRPAEAADQLVALGAVHRAGACAGTIGLADVDGNPVCLIAA